MVILKTRDLYHIRLGNRKDVAAALAKEAETGVLLLPEWCELVAVTESSADVQIITGDRPQAELEAELALALGYLSAQHDCETCAHEPPDAEACLDLASCEACRTQPCACRYCYGGSAWQWRGAHGKD
jgi:hypothetical protein